MRMSFESSHFLLITLIFWLLSLFLFLYTLCIPCSMCFLFVKLFFTAPNVPHNLTTLYPQPLSFMQPDFNFFPSYLSCITLLLFMTFIVLSWNYIIQNLLMSKCYQKTFLKPGNVSRRANFSMKYLTVRVHV